MQDEGIYVKPEDYGDASDYDDPSEDNREFYAAQSRDFVDMVIYRITTNIRDILYENAIDMKYPRAFDINESCTSDNSSFYSIKQ